jgi:hypothetical protein
VPEHDAFGRPVGEDPLAGLGWSSSPPDAAARPDAAPGASPPRPPAPPPVRRVRSGFAGRLIAFAALLATVALVALTGLSAVDTSPVTIDRVSPVIPSAVAQEEQEGAGPGRPARVVPLTTPGGLRAGVRRLKRDVPGRLQSFRLEKRRIDVTVMLRGGRLRSARLLADGEAAQILSATGAGFPAANSFSYGDLRPGAPARLIRTANTRLGKRTSQVNYLLLTRSSGALTWGVYYRDGSIGQGDASGRYTRTVG